MEANDPARADCEVGTFQNCRGNTNGSLEHHQPLYVLVKPSSWVLILSLSFISSLVYNFSTLKFLNFPTNKQLVLYFWVFFYLLCLLNPRTQNSMLNHLFQWRNPLHLIEKSRILPPLTSLIFTKPSVSAAKLDDEPRVQNPRDTVSEILAGLKTLGLRRFTGGQYFKTVVYTLNQPQVALIIDSLRIEHPESALDFFDLLRNVYGFRHSRVSRLVVSHVLASNRWFKCLRFVMKQMVDEEGIIFLSISIMMWVVFYS